MTSREDDRLTTLRSIPLFAELDDDALGQVLDAATEFEVARGHVLIQPGQPGEGLFVIEKGSATVERSGRSLDLGPGEFFGELALLSDKAIHTARVSAAGDLTGLAVSRSDLDRLLESQPKMALAMLRTLATRLAADERV